MIEQKKENDDRDRNAKEPEQNRHDEVLLLDSFLQRAWFPEVYSPGHPVNGFPYRFPFVHARVHQQKFRRPRNPPATGA